MFYWTNNSCRLSACLCLFASRPNGNSGVADITMKEAVEYLSKTEETYQHCGASYIQHNTFIDDKAKEEVVCLVIYNGEREI